MDVVSHALVGVAIAASQKYGVEGTAIVAAFSVLPDILQIPLYARVGREFKRRLWIPKDADWSGFRKDHPLWSLFFDVPHSIFFLIPVYLVALWFHLSFIIVFAYGIHIFLDIFTHRGEWGVKLFYPATISFDGFSNAWSWGYKNMITTWLVLALLIYVMWRL